MSLADFQGAVYAYQRFLTMPPAPKSVETKRSLWQVIKAWIAVLQGHAREER